MASRSSSQIKRRSERRKAEDSGDERQQGGGSIAQSSHRASHHSSRARKTTRPVVINNFNGNGNISINYAIEAEKEGLLPSPRSQQPGPAQTNSLLTPSRKKEREAIARIEELGSSDSSASSSRESSPAPPSSSNVQQLPTQNTPRSSRALSDEGYHTRGSSTRRGKAKSYNTRKLDEVSWNRSPSKTRSQLKRPSRYDPDRGSDDGDVSADDTHLAKEEDNGDSDDDSDDDFGHRTIKLEGPHKEEIEIRAILDTGTKPNWVSSHFLERLKRRQSKLRDDQNKEYKDFNGRRFQASGTVDLDIMCDDFQGFKCKKKTFLVAKESSFEILLGKRTIKEEGLLRLQPRDTSGEGAYPGVQTDISKAEQLKIAQNRAKQEKEAEELAKKREERRAAAKGKGRQPPLANLASESRAISRNSRSRSPTRKGRGSAVSPIAPKLSTKEKSSSSSLEGTW